MYYGEESELSKKEKRTKARARVRWMIQPEFAKQIRREDGRCIFTGDDMVEASHLNLPGKRFSKRGVLLRMDLAHRFDYTQTDLLQPIEGGTKIMFNLPGHELHGTIANLSKDKALAVSAELKALRGIEIKF